jgi:hypothetical protein
VLGSGNGEPSLSRNRPLPLYRGLNPYVLGEIQFLDDDRVTSPVIRDWLSVLLMWRAAVHSAKVYLRSDSVICGPLRLPEYLDFVRRTFWNIKQHTHTDAVSLVSADVALFVSWGLSADILKSLAALQGISLP